MTDEFDLFIDFLEQSMKSGKINNIQQEYLLSTYSDEIAGSNELDEFGILKDEYETFKNLKKNSLIREKQNIEYQKNMIIDFMNEANKKQVVLESQLPPLKKQFDQYKQKYDNWNKRWLQFPDNPNLKKEVLEAQSPMDQIHSQIIQIQQEVDIYRFQIKEWEKELLNIKN